MQKKAQARLRKKKQACLLYTSLRLEISYALKTGKNIIPIMMNGFEWPEELPDEIVDLKHYNGVNVSFDFFDGVIKRIIKCMSLSTEKKDLESEQNIKHILFWGDFDVANIEKITNRLKLDDDHYVEIMDEPIEVLAKNLEQIYAIILIVTDCTKFSANSDARTGMNETLVEYVKKGGKLICAHDVISVSYTHLRRALKDGMLLKPITAR